MAFRSHSSLIAACLLTARKEPLRFRTWSNRRRPCFGSLVLFACLLSLDRVFQSDFEDGTLERLALSDVPLEGLAVAKIAANWFATAFPLCVAAPAASALLFGFSSVQSLYGCSRPCWSERPTVCAVGAFGAAATVSVKRGGLLLPVLALPFCIPTLIFGTSVTESAARRRSGRAAAVRAGRDFARGGGTDSVRHRAGASI